MAQFLESTYGDGVRPRAAEYLPKQWVLETGMHDGDEYLDENEALIDSS